MKNNGKDDPYSNVPFEPFLGFCEGPGKADGVRSIDPHIRHVFCWWENFDREGTVQGLDYPFAPCPMGEGSARTMASC